MNKLAFDSDTNRHIDESGILHVDKTNISKAIVNPYYGKEIPRFQELGLDADTVYQLLRDPEELKKAEETFNNLPVLSEHIPVFSDKPPKDKIIGSLGSDAKFDGTYLTNSMSIWDGSAIALIETDAKKELSSAYFYDADMTVGSYDGIQYDGIMRNIRGNHVAVVESGRAGSDVMVSDSNPFKTEDNEMKLTKQGAARLKLFQAATMSPKIAMDAKLLNARKLDKDAIKKALLAQDISPEQLDNILDAVIGVEESPETKEIATEPTEMATASDTEEGTPHEKLHSFLAEKGMSEDDIATAKSYFEPAAADEDEVEIEIKDDEEEGEKIDKPAMDAALKAQEAKLIKRFADLEQAKSDVRSVVGDVMGMDSAESVYKFALKQTGVKHEGVSDLAGLRAVFKASRGSVQLAQDSNSGKSTRKALLDRFPNLGKF
jgi:uncharacterized protein